MFDKIKAVGYYVGAAMVVGGATAAADVPWDEVGSDVSDALGGGTFGHTVVGFLVPGVVAGLGWLVGWAKKEQSFYGSQVGVGGPGDPDAPDNFAE
jgi:ABC-type Fe3+ transport system permease subunit